MSLTVDCTGGTAVGTGVGYDGLLRVYLKKNTIDVGGATILAAGTKTSTDLYQALDVPANTWVLGAWFIVVKAESTNTTLQVELGDGDDTDGYVAAATVAAKTTHCAVYNDSIVYSVRAGKMYKSADTIDLLCSVAAPTNVVIDVYALCVEMSAMGSFAT